MSIKITTMDTLGIIGYSKWNRTSAQGVKVLCLTAWLWSNMALGWA